MRKPRGKLKKPRLSQEMDKREDRLLSIEESAFSCTGIIAVITRFYDLEDMLAVR